MTPSLAVGTLEHWVLDGWRGGGGRGSRSTQGNFLSVPFFPITYENSLYVSPIVLVGE